MLNSLLIAYRVSVLGMAFAFGGILFVLIYILYVALVAAIKAYNGVRRWL